MTLWNAKPPLLGTVIFGALAIVVAVASVLVGRYLYIVAAKPPEDFYAKLGELATQLAVIVIVGALVKAVVDWGASQRARYLDKLEARKEFMRRVRAMHVTIQNARDLVIAHRSAKTWSEQSRRLMALRPEVEEISEDLKASGNLFTNQSEIVDGLEAIISYLAEAGEEYKRSHDDVDREHKDGKNLSATIEQSGMTWVSDFMNEGPPLGSRQSHINAYQDIYVKNLNKSKRAMRREVYGA